MSVKQFTKKMLRKELIFLYLTRNISKSAAKGQNDNEDI